MDHTLWSLIESRSCATAWLRHYAGRKSTSFKCSATSLLAIFVRSRATSPTTLTRTWSEIAAPDPRASQAARQL
jgi:hypothetical protein